MSGVNIDYTFEDKTKIVPTQGKIDNITQKNSSGFRVQETDSFEFTIKLKNRAVVNLIQFKAMVGQKIFVQLLGERKTIIDSVSKKIDEHKADIIQFKESSQRKSVTTRVKIEIFNSVRILGVGLIYLLVKGEKVPDEKPKSVSKVPDNFFKDADYSVHKTTIADRKKEVFDDRKKRRIQSEIYDLERSYEDEKMMKKVLQESKKEYMQEQKKGTVKREKRQVEHKEESMSLYVQPRDYTKVDFEKCKNIFKNVNITWLEAQKKEQIKRGIKESERLSSAIQVRHFNNKKMFIDILPHTRKHEVEKLCEQMGANVLKDPCDYCIFITNRVDTQRVAKAKKLKHVKILKPSFVQDCKKCEAYLDQKDYFHKL